MNRKLKTALSLVLTTAMVMTLSPSFSARADGLTEKPQDAEETVVIEESQENEPTDEVVAKVSDTIAALGSADFGFTLRAENFAFSERITAVVVDLGEGNSVAAGDLDAADFTVHAYTWAEVPEAPGMFPGMPSTPAYTRTEWNDNRTITDVYPSAVDNYGFSAASGRYIVIKLSDWGTNDTHDYPGNPDSIKGGDGNPDGGSTIVDSLSVPLNIEYEVAYGGSSISLTNGDLSASSTFEQTAIISPAVDKFQAGSVTIADASPYAADGAEYTLTYQYYLNPSSDKLPLVVTIHGAGQGLWNGQQIRYSNMATVWAEDANQAENPCHVLAPNDPDRGWGYGGNDVTSLIAVRAAIDKLIATGKVDTSRIYITGYSMGGAAVWRFAQMYPNLAAAIAPLCAAAGMIDETPVMIEIPGFGLVPMGGEPSEASIQHAKDLANLPIWSFVTTGDDTTFGVVQGIDDNYKRYFNNYKLTVLPDNAADFYPYNNLPYDDPPNTNEAGQHVFHPHCVWIPVYNGYKDPTDLVRGTLAEWLFAQQKVDPKSAAADYKFTLRAESFAFAERITAVIIDLGEGKSVAANKLSKTDFNVYAHTWAEVPGNPGFPPYVPPTPPSVDTTWNDARTITDVYPVASADNYKVKANEGRYIVVKLLDWGQNDPLGQGNPDGGSTIKDGAGQPYQIEYTVQYKGTTISLNGKSLNTKTTFGQTAVVNPVVDAFKAGIVTIDVEKVNPWDTGKYTLTYQLYTNPSDEKLPLVVTLHGMSQGSWNGQQIRYSNTSTVWAEPSNQAKYPCHVLAPNDPDMFPWGTFTNSNTSILALKAAIDKLVATGKVDENRIYITGYSMGGQGVFRFAQLFPDVAAAIAPLCAAGGMLDEEPIDPTNPFGGTKKGEASIQHAKDLANMPIWCFTTVGDGNSYDIAHGIKDNYSQYWKNYKLTVLQENAAPFYPYNNLPYVDPANVNAKGEHVFHPHCVWIPVYNGYKDPTDYARGTLADWFFAQSKANVKLSSVTVNGSASAYDGNETFSLTVSNGTTTVDLSAIAYDPGATVVGSGVYAFVGDTQTYEVTVTARNGGEKTYKVVVNRQQIAPPVFVPAPTAEPTPAPVATAVPTAVPTAEPTAAPAPDVSEDSISHPPIGTHVNGTPTKDKLIVAQTDGNKEVDFPAVNINDYNYIKLRDLAAILNGTAKQFSIGYDAKTNTVTITRGRAYAPVGDELTTTFGALIDAIVSGQKFVVNGRTVDLKAYNIGGYNYFRLRDLAKVLGFKLEYEGGFITIKW